MLRYSDSIGLVPYAGMPVGSAASLPVKTPAQLSLLVKGGPCQSFTKRRRWKQIAAAFFAASEMQERADVKKKIRLNYDSHSKSHVNTCSHSERTRAFDGSAVFALLVSASGPIFYDCNSILT